MSSTDSRSLVLVYQPLNSYSSAGLPSLRSLVMEAKPGRNEGIRIETVAPYSWVGLASSVSVSGSEIGAMVEQISRLMLLVDSSTWGRMQCRNASEDHRPRIMILAVDWFITKREFAASDLMNLVPISTRKE